MLSSRQSLWTSVGGGDAGIAAVEPARRPRRPPGTSFVLRALPAVRPALHLAREEAVRLAERLEADGLGVDGVEVGQRVDHDLGELAVLRRVLRRRRTAAGTSRRTTTPRRRSITKNGAPMTAVSSQ